MPRVTLCSILPGCLSRKQRGTDGKEFYHVPQHHTPNTCEIHFPPNFQTSLLSASTRRVAWPSGLRRWIKAPVSSGAWVRIPPLPSFSFLYFRNSSFAGLECSKQGLFLAVMINLRFLTQEAVDCHLFVFHFFFCSFEPKGSPTTFSN